MQVSVEATSNLERKMTVELGPEKVDSQVQQRLSKLQKTASLKGFRKGKVPQAVLKKYYGESVRFEVIEEIMRQTLFEALEQEDLKPAGMPSIEPKEMSEGKGFSYTATFEVFPDIKLIDLSGETIDKTVASIDKTNVQETIDKLRQQHAEWIEIERAAANGDTIIVDFEGFIDGEAFDGGTATDFSIEIGVTQMIPGFVDGLIGAKAGETRELNVRFPEDYGHEPLAGKDAMFKVTIKAVKEAKLPELNEEFFKELDLSEPTLAGLEAEITDNLQRELDDVLLIRLKQKVFERLQEKNAIDIPQALIDAEVDHMRKNIIQQAGGKLSLDHVPADPFKEEARKRVHVGLLVNEVVKQHDIKVDEDKVRARVEELASRYAEKEQIIAYYYTNKKMLGEIEMQVLEEQVVEKLLEAATINEQQQAYSEVMNNTNGEGSDERDGDDSETA